MAHETRENSAKFCKLYFRHRFRNSLNFLRIIAEFFLRITDVLKDAVVSDGTMV